MSHVVSEELNHEVVLGEILRLNVDACKVSVCLASIVEKDDAPTFQKLQLSDELTEEFRGLVQAVGEKWRKDSANNDLKLLPYEPGSKPDSYEVEYVDLAQHEAIGTQIASLSLPAALEIFEGTDEFISGLRFYVIILQHKGNEPIYCFRAYSKKKELSRSPFFAAFLKKGHFDRVHEPTFLFDQYIDCLCQGNTMFIFNKDRFQKIFRFFEMVLSTAKATLKIIETRVPIANFDDFQTACEGHLQMLAKLKNIAGKPYLAQLTIADIKKVMKEFPRLKVPMKQVNGKEMLVFDPSDKWALLRLLDDDYLNSTLTGEKYEVSGKRQF